MKLGILETSAPPAALKELGDYPAMFVRLLRDAGFEGAIDTLDVQKNAFPTTPEAYDAYLVTGSAAGVYDPEPWIAPLIDFLRAAKGRSKLVGVCFGHQVMAEAFGGKVIKSPKGWGLGLQDYAVEDAESSRGWNRWRAYRSRRRTRTRWSRFRPAPASPRPAISHLSRRFRLRRPAGNLDPTAPGVRTGLREAR